MNITSRQLSASIIIAFLYFFSCSVDHPLGPESAAPRIIAMPDTSVSVNDSFEVHVFADSSDSDPLKFIWNIRELKMYDTLREAGRKIVFPRAGRFTIVVTAVTGGDIASEADTIAVTVFAKPPLIAAFLADSAYNAHDTARISVVCRDSDGVIMKFLWSFDARSFDTTTDSTLSTVLPFAASGSKTLYVKVIDDDGLVSQVASLRIRIEPGAPTIKAMNDTSVMVKDTLLLRAFAFDANGKVLEYRWSFDKRNWDATADPVKKVAWSIREYGTKMLYVRAMDDDSLLSNLDSAVIKVRLGAPVISAMPETTVAVNDTFTLHATAVDSNGTIKSYFWTADGNHYDTTLTGRCGGFGSLSSYGHKSEWVKKLENNGIVPKNDSLFHGVVAVFAADNDGIFTDMKYIVVNFRLYKPTVVAMDDTTVAVSDTVALHAVGADTNGVITRYAWSLNGTLFDTTAAPAYKTVFSPADSGGRRVFVKVIDDDGLVSDADSTAVFVRP